MTTIDTYPTTLEMMVGQNRVREHLRTWIDRALMDNKPLPHTILTGPSGFGKTAFAKVITNALGLQDHVLELDLSKMDGKRLESILTDFGGGVILADECHMAKSPQQDLMLQVLREGKIVTSWGEPHELPRLTTVVAMTSQPEKLNQAFFGRFTIKEELGPYSVDEMTILLHQMAPLYDVDIEQDAARLALATLGIPAFAHQLLEAYATLRPNSTVEGALELANREPDGLTPTHLRYLTVLRDLGGQLGERPLTNVLRIHPVILADIERTLMDKGFLRPTPSGRMLTPQGRRRIRKDLE